MKRNIKHLTDALGAQVVGVIPEVGGGAFGAARLASIVNALRQQLKPSQGLRPGRPTNRSWARRSKVAMSAATERKLKRLAKQASREGRKVSPMQMAAQLLEEALADYSDA